MLYHHFLGRMLLYCFGLGCYSISVRIYNIWLRVNMNIKSISFLLRQLDELLLVLRVDDLIVDAVVQVEAEADSDQGEEEVDEE